MNSKKRIIFIMLSITLVIIFMATNIGIANTEFKKRTLTLGHLAVETHPLHKGSVAFAEYVEEATGGKVSVEIYPSSVLGDQPAMVEQTILGDLNMTPVGAGVLQNLIPEYGSFALPFLFRDAEHAYRTLDHPEIKAALGERNKAIGLHHINDWDWGFPKIATIDKPVRKPEDLKGLKIRIAEEIQKIVFLKKAGAIPTVLPWTEIYTALQTKMVDGMENPFVGLYLQGFYEQLSYITNLGYTFGHCTFVMNQDLWNDLEPGLQKIIEEGAELGKNTMRTLMTENELESLEMLREDDKTVVIDLTEKEKEEWIKLGKSTWDELSKNVGGKEWVKFLAEIAKEVQ